MVSWIIVAISAYLIAAIVSVLDKVILSGTKFSPLSYAAWVGIFGIYGLFLIPFGFQSDFLTQDPQLAVLSLISGAVFVFGLYFFFSAIELNEVSRISPVFGVLVAIFIFLLGKLSGIETLDNIQMLAFLILISSTVLLSVKIHHIRGLNQKSFWYILAGAFLFAVSFVLIKIVYSQTEFLNGFVAGRIGEVLAGILLLIPQYSSLKKHSPSAVLNILKTMPLLVIFLFVFNKALGGLFFILQNYAVYLGSVSLVQSMEGVRYVFLLIFAIILSKTHHLLNEKLDWKNILVKIISVILICLGLGVLALRERPMDLAPGLKEFGVTYSRLRAEELGLDWKKTYEVILDDLKVRKIRVSAYWNEIESVRGKYDFSDLDWQIKEAEKRNAKLIMTIGQRLPRWPECRIPDWAMEIPENERHEKLLKVMEMTVNRYKNSPAVEYWQVENEPFLKFGICPPFSSEFLDREVALVHSLDNRQIIVNDSGELSLWIQAARRADIFGTTMYRVIHSKWMPGGYLTYPLPPSFFHLKANLVKYFADTKDIIVTELEAEPWGPSATLQMSAEERDKSLSLKHFKSNIEYARQVGFREAYLWGVEWWYWEKLNGRPEFWDYAKTLF